jgi:hypothetical protein
MPPTTLLRAVAMRRQVSGLRPFKDERRTLSRNAQNQRSFVNAPSSKLSMIASARLA